MITLDTNVIIYYLAGDPAVVSLVDDALAYGSGANIASITIAELFSYGKLTEEENKRIDRFLELPSIISLELRISRLAGIIRRLYKLQLADAIIAATALYTKTSLVTRNVNDFRKIPDLKIQGI